MSVSSSRRKHIRTAALGGGGLDYGTPLAGLSYSGNSVTFVSASPALFGLSGNANGLTDPGGEYLGRLDLGTNVRSLTMTTPGDLSAVTLNATYSLTTGNTRVGFFVRPDGTNYYQTEHGGGAVMRQIAIPSWVDLSPTVDGSISMTTLVPGWGAAEAGDLWMNPAGDAVYYQRYTPAPPRLYKSVLSTPWEISTAGAAGAQVFSDVAGQNRALCLTPDEKWAIQGMSNNLVRVFEMSTPGDLTTMAFTAEHDLSLLVPAINTAYGVEIDVFRKKFYLGNRTSGIVYEFDWTG